MFNKELLEKYQRITKKLNKIKELVIKNIKKKKKKRPKIDHIMIIKNGNCKLLDMKYHIGQDYPRFECPDNKDMHERSLANYLERHQTAGCIVIEYDKQGNIIAEFINDEEAGFQFP